ncbi:hypothetical protein [Sphingomonas sp. CCH16-B10]|jgi:hypothetical protein|uniref:hypothetical protein n=1 Tax=Sphingomonas sp. CCH16-B10 TaxID=1768755 RepID=UPI001E4680FF|nr:hypothetical protein [Sphingomonas sp. CCH16-B10]
MIRAALMAVLAALLWPAAAHAQDADRRVSVSPYIEAGQVLVAELDDDGDVLTYSTIAVGIDAVARAASRCRSAIASSNGFRGTTT